MFKVLGTILVIGFCLAVGSFCPILGLLLLILTGNFDP